jgi:hypothetical protein
MSRLAAVLNVPVYELFKPEGALPDNLADMIEKYSDDLARMFNGSLDNLRCAYLSKLNQPSV